MQTRAAMAWKAGEPLTIETIEIEGPKAGEVLVEMMVTRVCDTVRTALRALWKYIDQARADTDTPQAKKKLGSRNSIWPPARTLCVDVVF